MSSFCHNDLSQKEGGACRNEFGKDKPLEVDVFLME